MTTGWQLRKGTSRLCTHVGVDPVPFSNTCLALHVPCTWCKLIVSTMPVPQSAMEDSTQSTSWADRMEDLEASKITPGDFVTHRPYIPLPVW